MDFIERHCQMNRPCLVGYRHPHRMKCAVHPRRLWYNTAVGTLGRGRRVFVGLIPRKFIGLSCLRHPDQSSVVDHAWELRTHSRSPSVPGDRRPEGRLEEEAMQVVHPVCYGIDVHRARLTACLRCVQADGQVTQDVREFATTYSAL
jgi:hypothetical protein